MLSLSPTKALVIYHATRKYYTLSSCLLVAPWSFDFLVNNRISWANVEMLAPTFFIIFYIYAPLGPDQPMPFFSLKPAILPFLFLTHYLKLFYSIFPRRIVLDSCVVVPFISILFNIVNGSLLGTYLSSKIVISYLTDEKSSWAFSIGVVLWFLGIMKNITHNSQLVHREVISGVEWEVKAKATKNNKKRRKGEKQRTGILFMITSCSEIAYISDPNYQFEWLEWLGFAIASAPPPFSFQSSSSSLLSSLLTSPSQLWLPSLTPPYIFLIHLTFLLSVGTSRSPIDQSGPPPAFRFFLVSSFFVLVLCCKIYYDALSTDT